MQRRRPLDRTGFTMTALHSLIVSFVHAIAVAAAQSPPSQQDAPAAPRDAFAAVQTIFEEHCNACHTGPRAARKANFESLEHILAERPGRPALIVPGDPNASELYRRVIGASEPRMPIDGPPWLSDEQIEIIRKWIADMNPAAQSPVDTPPSPAPAPTTLPPPTQPAATPPAAPTTTPNKDRDDPITFKDIRPILATHCMRCHVDGGERGPAPEGLVLTSLPKLLRSGERPVVIPGNAPASVLLRHISGKERPRMPFDGPPWLTDEEYDLIKQWINDGARDDDGTASPMPVNREVRLEGILTAQWIVDDVPFRLAPGIRLRDIRVGSRVEVRATVQPDGSLQAVRVRGR